MAELTNIRIQTLSKAVPTAAALALHKVNVVGNTLVVEDRQGVQYVLGSLYAENIVVETPPMPQECGCSTTNAQVLATLIKGVDGEDGATFIPSVDSAGNLSWSNNRGLANPPTVNIKGPKGDAGSGGGTITEIKANGTSIAKRGVANIPAASTSAYGVIKLSSSTSSTSTTLAATASAVKAAYDLANSKASMTDVNNAIAASITNVINASY